MNARIGRLTGSSAQSAAAPSMPLMDPGGFTYSVVIPVYNSEAIVGDTLDQVAEFFEREQLSFEIIAVNDGSRDGSWEVLKDRARRNPNIVALNLLHNYGQHSANLAGFRESTGDYVVTMDDDQQNPPDQIMALINEAMTGRDVVFGKFDRKQAAGYRSLGSKAIGVINRRIFGQPSDLAVSNFRILRRDVVARICASRNAYPYITGQALLYSSNRAHVTVRHEPRPVGKSTYGMLKIARLVMTILFSYSSYPLRFGAMCGSIVAAGSFIIGAIYLVKGLITGTRVEGWTSLVVLLSFLNGVTIALLSMLGEYVIRTLNAVSAHEPYHVVERVKA
ncbi:MAG: glycosyltransferase [Nitriliruptorales bacterium]|nr:glycosyltransferase [Nitriliruptorales bacterium]